MKALLIRPLLLVLYVLAILAPSKSFGQYPKLTIEQKTNLSYITCLDNFELESKQINWQAFDFSEQEFLFSEIQFTNPDSGFALTKIQGSGETDFFVKTSDGGESWDFDPLLKSQYASNMHIFGKDTIILLGKNRKSWYTYEYFQYHSYDRGLSWDSTQTNIDIDPQKSFFLHAKLGYAVDVNGQTYASTDMGATWETRGKINIGSNIKMWFQNKDTGFLLTTNALLKTNDGAHSWSEVELPSNIGFTDMQFHGNIGFITGKVGIILKTEDYGTTWHYSNTKVFPHLNGISIRSKDSIFISGNQGTILSSVNGGDTWEEQHADTKEDLRTLFYIDAQHIFAGGNFTFLKYYHPLHLTNYNWQPGELIISQENNLIEANSEEDRLFSVTANSDTGEQINASFTVKINSPGIFISRDSVPNHDNKLQLHALTDAGSWTTRESAMYETWYHDVEFTDKNTGFIVGQYNTKGIVLKSEDGGNTWFHIPQKFKTRLDDVEFINTTTGYASGYQGYMIKTSDGGNTWFEVETPTNEDISTISFLTEDLGYAAANNRKILKTIDGGESWEEIAELNYDWAIELLFLNEHKGFFLHNYSGFLSTVDGGKTWQEVEHDKFFDVMDIQFVNDTIGYAVGGMLGPFLYLKTIDGGESWNQEIFPRSTLTTYSTMFFEDEFTGFVFNDLGEILTTADGAQNWLILDTLRHPSVPPGLTGYNLNGFQFVDKNSAIGVGNGHIFHFQRSPNLSFTWFPEDLIEKGNTAHPFVTANESAIFYGQIEREGACGVYNAIEIEKFTSINQLPTTDYLKIYPLPAKDKITIETPDLNSFHKVELIDATGNIQFSENINHNNKVTIYPHIKSGIYILRLSGTKNTITQKISVY